MQVQRKSGLGNLQKMYKAYQMVYNCSLLILQKLFPPEIDFSWLQISTFMVDFFLRAAIFLTVINKNKRAFISIKNNTS